MTRNGIGRWIRAGMAGTVLAAAGLTATPPEVQGQVEVGLDGGFLRTTVDQQDDEVVSNAFTSSTGLVRVGIPLGERLLLEPLVSFAYTSVDGREAWGTRLVPGLVWLFGETGGTRPYLRGEVGLLTSDAEGNDRRSQWSAGGAAGVRFPTSGDALIRLEAGWARFFEDDPFPDRKELRLLAGVSVPLGGR